MTCTNLDQLIDTLKTQYNNASLTLKAYEDAIKGEFEVPGMPIERLIEGKAILRGQLLGLQQSLQAAQTLKRGESPKITEFTEEGVRLTIIRREQNNLER